MTHTLHRLGDEESFENDFPFLSRPAMKFNHEGAAPKMRRVIEIALDEGPVNWGSLTTQQNMMLGFDREDLLSKTEDNSPAMGCFDDAQKVLNVLKKLKEEEIGMSVTITGLREKVESICREAGLTPHSADLSLGLFGNLDGLPSDDVMSLTTMCGHAMISAGLVEQIKKSVNKGLLSPQEGAKMLAKPCYCGIFNITRAEQILSKDITEK